MKYSRVYTIKTSDLTLKLRYNYDREHLEELVPASKVQVWLQDADNFERHDYEEMLKTEHNGFCSIDSIWLTKEGWNENKDYWMNVWADDKQYTFSQLKEEFNF